MFHVRFGADYLLHKLTAKSRHGTHSPFVYRLVDEVIYDFSEKELYPQIEKVRKRLLNDKTAIDALPAKLAQLIYRLAADMQPKNIVGIGAGPGIVTRYLHKAVPHAKIYTLEHSGQTAAIAAENIEQIVGDNHLKLLIDSLPQLDFVYVGKYQKDAIIKYLEWCLPKVHENSLLIFSDIYRDKSAKQAWAQIKTHPKVSITVDLFWIGLVYFKKGKQKEDFRIRF